jgi:flagellar biosynthesis protein FlhG
VKDQAETLRKGTTNQGLTVPAKKARMNGVARVISVTSGKGGVGKTTTVVNLALCLARSGKNVLILDADVGLANVDVMLGLSPKYTLHDLFEGRKTLAEIMLTGPEGVGIIPAASGVEEICNLDTTRRLVLMQAIEEIADQFDYLLIDTPAGIGPDVLYFNSASSEIVVVVNEEPTSLTDAYALIKVLSQNYDEKSFSVLVNEARDGRAAETTFNRLNRAIERFLHVELRNLGFIPSDTSAVDAVRSQKAVVELYPSSPAALGFAALARKLEAEFYDLRVKGGMQFFFRQLLEMSAHGG